MKSKHQTPSAAPNELKSKFRTICFCSCVAAVAVAVNCLCSRLPYLIKFPLYFDSVLTIFVVALCGLAPGIICAVLSNLLLFLIEGKPIVFCVCHILTAVGAYFIFLNADKFQEQDEKSKSYAIDIFLWAGIVSAISNTFFGNIISSLIISNETDSYAIQGIFLRAIYASIPNLILANCIAGFLENIMDKLLSAIISFFVYRFVVKARN